MHIGYLIPEFPGQTHNFFWTERDALRKIGVETCLISTRRPNEVLVSHSWAKAAQAETSYLAEVGIIEALAIIIDLAGLGPKAWLRAIKASAEGCPPKQIFFNLALIFFAMRLVILVRSRGLVHVHSHSCGPAALIAMLANRLAGVSYSLTLHGEMIDYPQQNIKFRYASNGT